MDKRLYHPDTSKLGLSVSARKFLPDEYAIFWSANMEMNPSGPITMWRFLATPPAQVGAPHILEEALNQIVAYIVSSYIAAGDLDVLISVGSNVNPPSTLLDIQLKK